MHARLQELRRDLDGGGYLARLAVNVGRRTYVLSIVNTDWIEASTTTSGAGSMP